MAIEGTKMATTYAELVAERESLNKLPSCKGNSWRQTEKVLRARDARLAAFDATHPEILPKLRRRSGMQ